MTRSAIFATRFAVLAIALLVLNLAPWRALAEDTAPLTIAVHTSTEPDSGRRTADAIRAYTTWQAETINAAGGVRGRLLQLEFFDDANDVEKTVENVEAALALDNLLGMVGVWSSTRGAAVTERVGESGVPFISEISRQELISGHPNVFSMARAASADLPSFIDFVTRPKKRVAYFGVEGDLFTLQFKETLERLEAEERVEVTSWEWKQGGALDPEAAARAIERVKRDRPDALILAIGSTAGGDLLKLLAEAGVEIPVYAASGSMVRMLNRMGEPEYGGPMFQTRSSVPGVTNSRLAALLQRPDFIAVGEEFGPSDRSYGASYADVIAVMAEAASGPASSAPLETIRADMIRNLARTSDGSRVFRGATRDWSFDEGGSATEAVYLLERTPGSRQLRLRARQVSSEGGGRAPRELPIANVSLDLVQIVSIDSTGETFDASFYLSIESEEGLTLKDFEFANIAQSDVGAGTMLSVRELSDGRSAQGGAVLRLYKIDGRFQFSPDLSRYPFDRQVFSIQLQPADATKALILQPPPEELRDTDYKIPGWRPVEDAIGQFIGADNELIRVATEGGATERIIAFQRYSFTWVAEREALDYSLRVVLPLALILLVAYLSVFIPKDRFDSAVSLQVTALLSAIALYLAIPKISPDVATLSDQAFVFAEAVIVLIIALSILRINSVAFLGGWIARVLGVVQVALFPLLALMMLRYVDAVRTGEGETVAGKSLGDAAEVMMGLLSL